MKKGLVMEGGSMRGLFTAGVIDVFLENNIEFDGSVGVSAGAAFGCNYKSRQNGRVLRYTKRYCNYWKFCSFRSWLVTGDIFGAKFCYYDIPMELDVFDGEAFMNNPMNFYLVATDINTGRPVYHKMDDYRGDNIEWLRASASMPGLSRPVKIGDSKYLDGGTADSIPLEFLQKKGYERNVVILTQPEGFVKEPLKALPLLRMVTHKYPAIAKALEARPAMYNAQTAYVKECEDKGSVLVIRPSEPLNIKSKVKDPNELQRVYDLGRKAAEAKLEELKAFLAG